MAKSPKYLNLQIERRLYQSLAPIFNAEVGWRLSYVREGWLRLRQEELAELLGITQDALSRIERGKRTLVDISFDKFRSILGRHTDYVLLGRRKESYLKFPESSRKIRKGLPDWDKDKLGETRWLNEKLNIKKTDQHAKQPETAQDEDKKYEENQ